MTPPPPPAVDTDTTLQEQVEEQTRQQTYGTFAGGFTPTLLTILGVIMYLRQGAVVGNAGRTERLLLWTCTVLKSGERKSAVVPKMMRPVERYEERQRRRILDERKGIENRREVFERVRRETIKDAAGDPDMLHQVDEVQARLDELEIPEPPGTRAGNSARTRRW